ncbi:hypothetical protein [Anaerocolumna chitinilytica]|uniref:Uncharacterized protein n=1 Tax=Anaerocolumna chitinilytica TaxID=1727145 RepID=A0A7I8DKC3_9FIRM|nr:hypothetical protein [Anaerocolumna chitinilytica]BCJ98117.1 hypothetical protein bsdcttw_11580 [Anaerocolumna chitinilytica]
MNKRGKIAEISGDKVKVIYENEGIMTPYLDVARHVTNLEMNSIVIVAIYDNDLRTGTVIGVI